MFEGGRKPDVIRVVAAPNVKAAVDFSDRIDERTPRVEIPAQEVELTPALVRGNTGYKDLLICLSSFQFLFSSETVRDRRPVPCMELLLQGHTYSSHILVLPFYDLRHIPSI